MVSTGCPEETFKRHPAARWVISCDPASTVCEEVELDDVRRLDVAMIEEALSRKSNLIIEI